MSNYNRLNVNTSYYSAHLLSTNWTAWIWPYLSHPLITVLFCNCVFLPYISQTVNMTITTAFLKAMFVIYTYLAFLSLNALAQTLPVLCPCFQPRPGHQALGRAPHKWVMAVTLTFGGRAGWGQGGGGLRECRHSLCLIKQQLINVWFSLASFFY